MKDSRTQSQKLAHNFLTCLVIITSFVLIAMGVCAAKNNTNALDSGVKPAMIYAARQDRQISVTIDRSVYTSPPAPRFSTDLLLRLAPTPLGSIYIIAQNISAIR